jgi:hypothetical protein
MWAGMGIRPSKRRLAQRMRASGESASTIANTLKVSRATVYRVLAEGAGGDQRCFAWGNPFALGPDIPGKSAPLSPAKSS